MMSLGAESAESSLCDDLSLSSLGEEEDELEGREEETTETMTMDKGGASHGSRSSLDPSHHSQPSRPLPNEGETHGMLEGADGDDSSNGNGWVIVEGMVESLGTKIVKAQWSKDLQEFSTEYSLPPSRFGSIRDAISGRCERYVRKGVRLLSASPRRPCWAIVSEQGEGLDERLTVVVIS